tara:strand:+ start:5603 stop:6328 length:726 start_codon:yes stop_codon:yes gene_type:complete
MAKTTTSTPVPQKQTATKETATKKTATKKTTTKTNPVEVVVTEPVSNVVVAATVSTSKADSGIEVKSDVVDKATVDPQEFDNQILEQSLEFIAKLHQIGVLVSAVKTEYRVLEKKWGRELKVLQKQNSKKKRKVGNRAPSGFVKPTKISEELSTFLEKPSGCEMARTEVTREINKYIRSNNLQDKTNGRKIIPDAKLTQLLKLTKTDELTYFNLQRYMSPHFEKSVKAMAAIAASNTTTTI